jgi:hypothetical protein
VILSHLLQPLQERRYTAQALLDALTIPQEFPATECMVLGAATEGDATASPPSPPLREHISQKQNSGSVDEDNDGTSADAVLHTVVSAHAELDVHGGDMLQDHDVSDPVSQSATHADVPPYDNADDKEGTSTDECACITGSQPGEEEVLLSTRGVGQADLVAECDTWAGNGGGSDADDPVSLSVAEEIQCRVEQLRSTDHAARARSAEVLVGLVRDADTRAMLATAGDVELWIGLLSSGADTFTIVAARALRSLTLNADNNNREIIGKAGAIPLLVKVLGGDSADSAKEAVLKALFNLGIYGENTVRILVENAIPLVLRCLDESSADTKEAASSVLRMLAYEARNCTAMVRRGALPLLVQLLIEGTVHAKEEAARILSMLPLDEGHLIASAGAIPPLVQLCSKGTERTKDAAIGCLWDLARIRDIRTSIIRAEAIPVLIGSLSGSTAHITDLALGTLLNLCCDRVGRAAVVSCGGIFVLIHLLRATAECTLKWVVQLLCVLVDDHSADAFAPTIPSLLEILRGCIKETQEYVVEVLAELATTVPNLRKTIASAGAIPLLVQLLKDGSTLAQEQGARALAHLHSETSALEVAMGVDFPVLVKAVREGPRRVQVVALYTIGGCSIHAQLHGAISAAGLIPALVSLFTSAAQKERELVSLFTSAAQKERELEQLLVGAACTTLHELARTAECSKAFAAAGAIPALLRLLKDGKHSVQTSATKALYALSKDPINKNTIAVSEALPLLVQLLREGEQAGKEYAAAVLSSLSQFRENNADIAQAGAIPPLVRLLRCDSASGQYTAVRALWQLSVDEACGRTIIMTGAIQLLVPLLKDDAEATRKAALGLLKNLANSEGLAAMRREQETLKWVRDCGALDVRAFAGSVLSGAIIR